MNPVATQSLSVLDTSGRSTAQPVTSMLPAGGSLQATVRQVSQDQLNPQVFRLRLESEGRLLELRTPQPLATGTAVTLQRSADGQQISIKADLPLPTPPGNKPTTGALPDTAATLNTGRIYQAPVSIAPNQSSLTQALTQLLPRQTAVPVQVLQQTAPASSAASQPPVNAATSQSTTPANQTASQPTAQSNATTVLSQPTVSSTTPVPPLNTTYSATPAAATTPQTNTTPPTTQSSSTSSSAQTQTTAPLQAPSTPPATPTRPAPLPYAAANLTTQAHTTHSQLSVAIKGEVLNLLAPANLPSISRAELIRPAGEQLFIRFAAPPQAQATAPAIPSLTAAQAQIVQQGLREVLPHQMPIADGMNQLLQLQSASITPQVTDKVIQSLLQLFGVRPGSSDAPETIRQNVNFGGLFTENQLAKKAPIANDMKQFLGKLQTLADQLPLESKQLLQGTIDKMLSRITSQQLTHLQQRQERTDTTERFFQLDLPVKYQAAFENVELRIQQHEKAHESGEKEKVWQVHLHFDLMEKGQVDADLSLNEQQHTVTTAFFCSNQTTAHEVSEKLTDFEAQLQMLGLHSTSITCKQGQAQRRQQPAINTQLIDVKT